MNPMGMLLAMSVPFQDADEETWETYCTALAWQEALGAWDKVLTDWGKSIPDDVRNTIVRIPSFEEHRAFTARTYTGGLPTSALPVESLYVDASAALTPTTQAPSYLQQTAYYMRRMVELVGVELPDAFRSIPDHLSVELIVGAELLSAAASPEADADTRQACRHAASDYFGTRFTWLEVYRQHLLAIPALPEFYPALVWALGQAAQAIAVEI